MTVSSKPRLYDLMEEHGIGDKAALPDQATLDEIQGALHGIYEFLIDPAANAVIGVAIEGKANSITHEDIGRLIVWADAIRDLAIYITDSMAKVNVAAREAYPIARGYDDGTEIFSEYGSVQQRERFDYVLQRFDGAGGRNA